MKLKIGILFITATFLTACDSTENSATNKVQELYQAAAEGASERFEELDAGVFEEEIADHVENSEGLDNIIFDEYPAEEFDEEDYQTDFLSYVEDIDTEETYYVVDRIDTETENRMESRAVVWVLTARGNEYSFELFMPLELVFEEANTFLE